MKWVWQMASLSQFGTFLLVLPFEGINGSVIALLVFGFIFMMLAAYCEEKEEE